MKRKLHEGLLIFIFLLLSLPATFATTPSSVAVHRNKSKKESADHSPSPERKGKSLRKSSESPLASLSGSHLLSNDPILFWLTTQKKEVAIGEEVEIVINGRLLDISPSLLFVFKGSNSFRLKLLLPDGFVQTGGDYVDLIGKELTNANPTVKYVIKGRFTKAGEIAPFRLLRGHGLADAQSLFVEKAHISVSVNPSAEISFNRTARLASNGCSSFSEVCSGNDSEIRNQTISVDEAGNYTLILTYRSPEKNVNGIVRINGVAQTVTFPQISTYQDKTVGTVYLTAGNNTIGLSSGLSGTSSAGYICFNNICWNSTASCNFTLSAKTISSQTNASVTLIPDCSGADCGSVTYTWSGNGVNQSGGYAPTFNAPATTGTYTYTVTASKSGCTTQTSTITLNVSSNPVTTITSGNCYVIRSKSLDKPLQASSGDLVQQQTANGQSNQIWKAESAGSQFKLTVQDGSNKSMSVNAANDGEAIRVGTYTGTDLQKWTIQYDNNSYFRVSTSGGKTWDLADWGSNAQLQLYGSTSEAVVNWRLFKFDPAACPVSACNFTLSAKTISAQTNASVILTPECSGADCGSVTYTWSGNGVNQSGGSAPTFNAPVTTGTYTYTVTASKSGCTTQTSTITLNVVSNTGVPGPGTRIAYASILGLDFPPARPKLGYLTKCVEKGLKGITISIRADQWLTSEALGNYNQWEDLFQFAEQNSLRVRLHLPIVFSYNPVAEHNHVPSWLPANKQMVFKNAQGSVVEGNSSQRYPSLEYLADWDPSVTAMSGWHPSTWDLNNPFYRIQEDYIKKVLQKYQGRFHDVTFGIASTFEVNYSTNGLDAFAGHEDVAQDGFRAFLLKKYPSIQNVTSYTIPINSDLTSSFSDDTMGKGKDAYQYREQNLERFIRFMTGLIRQGAPNARVGLDIGTSLNSQATLYGLLNLKRLSTPVDFIKENFYTAGNWKQFADKVRSTHVNSVTATTYKPFHAELDGSTYNRFTRKWKDNGVDVTYYGDNDVFQKVRDSFDRGMEELSIFAFSELYEPDIPSEKIPDEENVIFKLLDNLRTGGYLGTPVAVPNQTNETTFSSQMVRKEKVPGWNWNESGVYYIKLLEETFQYYY